TATANLWLGHGIGVFGTLGVTASDIRSAEAFEQDLPFIAERFARAGVTFVHPSRLAFTLAGTYVGDRTGDLLGARLDSYWTLAAAVTWQTPDRRLLMGLTLVNLLAEDYDLAPGAPGPCRAVAATGRARF